MILPAYNVTDRPVLIDDAGRQLGGLEWGAVDTTADDVQTAVRLGWLDVRRSETIPADANPAARQAAKRADELEERRLAYVDATADDVEQAARRAGLDVDTLSTKTERTRELLYAKQGPDELLADPDASDPDPAPTVPAAPPAKAQGARKAATSTAPEA